MTDEPGSGVRGRVDYMPIGRRPRLVLPTGALSATLELAQHYADEAKAALSGFARSPWREALEELADFAVSRTA